MFDDRLEGDLRALALDNIYSTTDGKTWTCVPVFSLEEVESKLREFSSSIAHSRYIKSTKGGDPIPAAPNARVRFYNPELVGLGGHFGFLKEYKVFSF